MYKNVYGEKTVTYMIYLTSIFYTWIFSFSLLQSLIIKSYDATPFYLERRF